MAKQGCLKVSGFRFLEATAAHRSGDRGSGRVTALVLSCKKDLGSVAAWKGQSWVELWCQGWKKSSRSGWRGGKALSPCAGHSQLWVFSCFLQDCASTFYLCRASLFLADLLHPGQSGHGVWLQLALPLAEPPSGLSLSPSLHS